MTNKNVDQILRVCWKNDEKKGKPSNFAVQYFFFVVKLFLVISDLQCSLPTLDKNGHVLNLSAKIGRLLRDEFILVYEKISIKNILKRNGSIE